MLEVDAYSHAQATFGAHAAVWRAAPDRCIVGRWTPLGEIGVPSVAGYAVGSEAVLLRTKRQGLLVLGEGRDWVEAFAAAEQWRKAVMS